MPHFPSGSSINYHNGKLYLIGDDADHILVLDKEYTIVDNLPLLDYPEKRIPKPLKPDFEASTIITHSDGDQLLIVGSGSKKNRKKIVTIFFSKTELDAPHFSMINYEIFITRLEELGIDEVNIEGVTVMGNTIILSNRGNRKNITNHFIITDLDFWKRQADVKLEIVTIQIPQSTEDAPAVSELCYIESIDTLLITFSSELTDNAYDDGAISNSYLGWISNASQKMQNQSLKVEQMINLSEVDAGFKNEKIEGVCLEAIDNEALFLHLISDNDLGESKLFKIRMSACV